MMGQYTRTYSDHLHSYPDPRIECETGQNDRTGESYPVLRIGGATFWPTRDQLWAIEMAISSWLAANPEIDGDSIRLKSGKTLDPVASPF